MHLKRREKQLGYVCVCIERIEMTMWLLSLSYDVWTNKSKINGLRSCRIVCFFHSRQTNVKKRFFSILFIFILFWLICSYFNWKIKNKSLRIIEIEGIRHEKWLFRKKNQVAINENRMINLSGTLPIYISILFDSKCGWTFLNLTVI